MNTLNNHSGSCATNQNKPHVHNFIYKLKFHKILWPIIFYANLYVTIKIYDIQVITTS
jgi:hypothetical protein